MNIRRRFLMLAVAMYAIAAVVVITFPWHGHRASKQALTASAVAATAAHVYATRTVEDADLARSQIPTLPVVTVRPDDVRTSTSGLRVDGRPRAPLVEVAGAASGSLLSTAAIRMPYYSFGRSARRENRE